MPRELVARWWLPAAALLAGIAGMSAAWVAAGALAQRPLSWLGLVAAVDVALMLRLTHAPAGRGRVAVAIAATALIVVLAQWLLAAARMGVLMGMEPLASALRLGPALAWQVVSLSLDRVDWVWLLASLPLAGILVQDPAPD